MATKTAVRGRGRPVTRTSPTRMLNVRIDQRLYDGLKAKAERQNRTLTAVLESMLERDMGKACLKLQDKSA